MNWNRPFTKKESIRLLILTVILLGLVYWKLVYLNVQDQIRTYDPTEIENESLIEQTKAARIGQMQKEMEINKSGSTGEVATYNNLKNEIVELNAIVSAAESYQFEFEDPYADGNTVRRDIHVNFTADSLDKAEAIIGKLYTCKYRLLIGDLNLQPYGGLEDLESGAVDVTATVTFYETLYQAPTTEGVIFPESDG